MLLGDEEMIEMLNSSDSMQHDESFNFLGLTIHPKQLQLRYIHSIKEIVRQLEEILQDDMIQLQKIALENAENMEILRNRNIDCCNQNLNEVPLNADS